MDKQEAIKRLDALDAEAKALRAIIEAKKEPRGLCWVWNHAYFGKGHTDVAVIVDQSMANGYLDCVGQSWVHAEPLTEEEMRTYRGRWE
jgi:hypothetical protein